MASTLDDLTATLRAFTAAREWQQFHSPKNLATALLVEAAELAEHFQWLTQTESRTLPPTQLEKVADEIGDVLIYLVRLADELGIDPLTAAAAKVAKNEIRYPAEKVRSSAKRAEDYG